MNTTHLSIQQQQALDYLRGRMECDQWASGFNIAKAVQSVPNGVSRTLGSLISRGLVERREHLGHMFYRAI
jgi:DNA-binding MarR family transcriptional regulator